MEMHCLDSLDIYEHISFFIDFSIEVIVFTGTLHLLHIEFLIKPYFHSTVQYCKHVHNVITEHQPEKPWKHNFCLYQWSLVEERWASSYTTPQHRITWPQSAEIHSDLQCSINTHTHTQCSTIVQGLSPYLSLFLGDLHSCEGDQHRHSGRHNLYNMLGESCVVVQQLIGMITQHGQDCCGRLSSHFVLALYRNDDIKWWLSKSEGYNLMLPMNLYIEYYMSSANE